MAPAPFAERACDECIVRVAADSFVERVTAPGIVHRTPVGRVTVVLAAKRACTDGVAVAPAIVVHVHAERLATVVAAIAVHSTGSACAAAFGLRPSPHAGRRPRPTYLADG